MSIELYPISITRNSTDYTGLWPTSTSGGRIDLREEFYEFLYGSTTEVAKGRPAILRRMRTDSSGDLIQCACVDPKTGEPDRDTICNLCWGEGYLWDEEWITTYKVLVSSHEGLVRKYQPHEPGLSNIPFVFFYMEYFVKPTRYDKIIEVSLDEEGDLVVPYKREAIFPISTAEAFRSDQGRIEYWRTSVVAEVPKSSWS